MNRIRRSLWAIMILGAAAGCAGEEEAAPPATLPSVPSPAPPPPPPVKSTPAVNPVPAPAIPGPKKPDDAPKVEGPKAENSKADAGVAKLAAEELAAIKLLSASDQEAATKQLVCPVSSENLGSMGKPEKVTAEGRTFYLCCKSCKKELDADPKKFIAKLDKKGDGK